MRIAYVDKKFQRPTLELIDQCNDIIEEYEAQGFSLTLRQLYYQLVSRDLLSNKQTEYKRLGSIVNDARMAGMIDWLAIEDRTRNLQALPSWGNPSHIIKDAVRQYRVDKWEFQPTRVEVWIEKDALTGVIAPICQEWRVPYFSCRGYTSASEMWRAAERSLEYKDLIQAFHVLHLGDHDPSGIDMTRDIRDRLWLLSGGNYDIEVARLALNWDQIETYSPPPNPAKMTDSRYDSYLIEYGEDSWELDALEPAVLADLIKTEIEDMLDWDAWDKQALEEEKDKVQLRLMAKEANKANAQLQSD